MCARSRSSRPRQEHPASGSRHDAHGRDVRRPDPLARPETVQHDRPAHNAHVRRAGAILCTRWNRGPFGRRMTRSRVATKQTRMSASRCSFPAGASPVSVSAGAPSSRPQARREIAVARAGCQEPLRREPARGPQHDVKPAASTYLQSESRAAELTVKAMSIALRSGGVGAMGLGEVRGAARVHGDERNTRDPSTQPGVGAARLV